MERWEGDSKFITVFRNGFCWVKLPFSDKHVRYDYLKQKLRKMELVKVQPLKYEPKKFINFINIG